MSKIFKPECVQVGSDDRGRLADEMLYQQGLSLWAGEVFSYNKESLYIRDFFGSGDQTYHSFSKIQFKGVVLELLVPICMREKSSAQCRGFFLPEASLHALDGVETGLPPSFLPWPKLTCLLLTQVSHYHPSLFYH